MIARVALLFCIGLVVAAQAAPAPSKMEALAKYFLSIYEVRQVVNTETALKHFAGIRKYNVQATNVITAQVRYLQSSLFTALGKVATVAEVDAQLAVYQKDEADLVAFLPSEQERWLVVARQGAGFLRKYTGNAKLEAQLNELAAAKVKLFETKLHPENRKLFDAAVLRFRNGLAAGKASHKELYGALYEEHGAISNELHRGHLNANKATDEKIGAVLANVK